MIRSSSRSRRVVAALAVTITLVSAACVVQPPPSVPPDTVKTLTNAVLEWTVSREADFASFAPGEVNYWSAGQSDSTAATYVATNGNATVLKKNASGVYVPIGSEPAVSWANRNKTGTGIVVTVGGTNYLGQKVRYTGGTGWVNTATGESSIQWTGTFTINFYGRYIPFWIINPKLTVNAAGVGKLTATMGGFASSLDNPEVRTPLPETPNVTLADLPSVPGANSTGFVASTAYLNTTITPPPGAGPQVPKTPANQAFWGAWPQSFVNFQGATGLGSYWYTSGGSVDPRKPSEPITVTYNIAP